MVVGRAPVAIRRLGRRALAVGRTPMETFYSPEPSRLKVGLLYLAP